MIDETSAIVAFVYPAAEGIEKQHELVKIMKGPVDLHRISYTLKIEEPSRETQMTWLGIFEATSLKEVTLENQK